MSVRRFDFEGVASPATGRWAQMGCSWQRQDALAVPVAPAAGMRGHPPRAQGRRSRPSAGGFSKRTASGYVALVLLLGASLGLMAATRSTASHNPVAKLREMAAAPGHARRSAGVLGAVSSQLGAADPAYRAVAREGTIAAGNPVQHLALRFTAAGMTARATGATLGLSLTRYGHRGALRHAEAVTPRASGNLVVYDYGALTETFANGPAGVEQSFTLRSAPPGTAGALTIALSASGSTRALMAHGSVVFTDHAGVVLRYDGLVARDASGRVVPSHLELRGGNLLIRVQDRGARYPLRIDPLLQQRSTLTPTDATGATPLFGWSLALSADGNTALVGGYADNGYVGAAWVFTRSASGWAQDGPKLTPDDASGNILFGSAVALSADGDTALVSGTGDEGGIGAAWVFARSGATWTQQGSKLTPSDATVNNAFGGSVALSADGDTALVGDANDHGLDGTAWVYTRTGSTWTQQGPALTGAGASGVTEFGSAVALSADGDTALIGGENDAGGTGAAWVFTRVGSTWGEQGPKLTASDEVAADTGSFGTTVALASDGNTALIGGSGNLGAAWVFTRSGTSWSQQGAALIPDDATSGAGFGWSVALSANGDTALIGAADDDTFTGAAWLFERSGTTWTQQGAKITGNGQTSRAVFGSSVALSANASTALIGGPGEDAGVGAAWVLTTPPAISSQTGLSFGAQTIDATGSAHWLHVQNSGGEPLVFTGPAQIAGANAGDFAIPSGGDRCDGVTLLPGQECEIALQFTPAAAVSEAATLTVGTNNILPADQPTVALDGTGTSPPSAPLGNSQPLSSPTGSTGPPSPAGNRNKPRPKTSCTLSEHRKRIDVRCALGRRPGHRVVLITVRHDSKIIASGGCAIDGTSLTASLRAQHPLSRRGRTTVTITTATGATSTVQATAR